MNWRALIGYGLAALAAIAIAVAVSGTLEETYGTAAMYVVLLLWCGVAVACFAVALVRDLIEGHQEELAVAASVLAAALLVLSILVPVAAIGAGSGLVEESTDGSGKIDLPDE